SGMWTASESRVRTSTGSSWRVASSTAPSAVNVTALNALNAIIHASGDTRRICAEAYRGTRANATMWVLPIEIRDHDQCWPAGFESIARRLTPAQRAGHGSTRH